MLAAKTYISKPIDTSTLSSKVRDLLARPPAAHFAPVNAELNNMDALDFSGPEIEGLLRRFLNDGTERSRQLLDSLNTAFDSAGAASQLHKWTGSAALLGYHEITRLSRKGEDLLREDQVTITRLRDIFTDLFLAFAELRDSTVLPLPEFVVQAITGKRIALIEFTAERADAMCAMLERVKARPLLFGAADSPDSEAIGNCDLAVFHVRPETLKSSWLQPGAPVPAVRKLVFTGDQHDLMALASAVRSRAVDFVVDREDPEGVLMRLAFAISRSLAAVSEPHPAAAPVAAGSPAQPRTAVTRPSVVLADDDGIVLALVKSTLQNYGMSCRSVDNGRDALRLIRSEQPHVAVLDVNMPGMDGYEVLAAVRAEKLPTRLILLTSLQQEKDILRAFNLGADDYLTKPFNPFELVARLKRLVQ